MGGSTLTNNIKHPKVKKHNFFFNCTTTWVGPPPPLDLSGSCIMLLIDIRKYRYGSYLFLCRSQAPASATTSHRHTGPPPSSSRSTRSAHVTSSTTSGHHVTSGLTTWIRVTSSTTIPPANTMQGPATRAANQEEFTRAANQEATRPTNTRAGTIRRICRTIMISTMISTILGNKTYEIFHCDSYKIGIIKLL